MKYREEEIRIRLRALTANVTRTSRSWNEGDKLRSLVELQMLRDRITTLKRLIIKEKDDSEERDNGKV